MSALTPDLLRSCYAVLRETLPFRRWRLPAAHEVVFAITRSRRIWGEHIPFVENGKTKGHVIRMSEVLNPDMETTLQTMAHEMCHIRLEVAGSKSRKSHGDEFKKLARLVCRHHPEFDPPSF